MTTALPRPPAAPTWPQYDAESSRTGPLRTIVLALAVGLGCSLLTITSPPLVIAGLVLIAVSVLLLARPDSATVLALVLIYANAGVVLVNVHGLPGPAAAVPFAMLLLPVAQRFLLRGEPVVWLPETNWYAAYGLIFLVSSITSPTVYATGEFVLVFLTEGFLFFVLLTNVVRTPRQLRRCLSAIVVAGAVHGAVSVAQQVRGAYWTSFGGFGSVGDRYRPGDTDWTNYENGTLEEGHARLAGSIGEPNFFAFILLVLLPYGLYLAMTSRGWVLRAGWGVATVLIAAGVVLTYSRGAIVALMVTTVVLACLRVIPRSSVLALFVAGSIALALVPGFDSRLEQGKTALGMGPPGVEEQADAAARGRSSEIVAALEVYRDHPALGVGPGQFPSYYQRYSGDASGGVHSTGGPRAAHNLVAGMAADTGTLGVVAFFGGVAVTVRRLLKLRALPRTRALATAAIASLALALTSSMFLHMAYMRYFWLHLALLAVLPVVFSEAEQPEDEVRHGR